MRKVEPCPTGVRPGWHGDATTRSIIDIYAVFSLRLRADVVPFLQI